jgi:dTDP-4-amino-4,6-dideoxygalactose transaminase
MAMVGLGVKPGDEVIVPAMSWISTSETVTQAGATVVFCDIDPVSYTLDPARLSEVITERTVGIIPVHLYGQPADMARIMQIADCHGIWVIEDCAQAHLAEINGRKVGTFGAAAAFSFYPGKNLGAMGDAGAVLSHDADLARRIAMFARHGGLRKGDHEIEGINSRMDGLQAAILNVKLPHLRAWTARRQALAAAYNAALAGCDTLTLPRACAGASAAWHLYVVRSPARAELEKHLKSHGIGSSRNYPRALPFLPCYARLQHRPEDFPIAYTLAKEGLSIPIFSEMTDEQLQRVVDVIRGFDPSESE